MPIKQTANTGVSEDTKTIVTVILLVFLFPIGFLMMWFWTKWKVWVKLLVSIPLLIIGFFLISAVLLVAVNPRAQFQKAECIKSCKETTPNANCTEKCSIQKQVKTDTTSSYPESARQAFNKSCLIDFSQTECTCAFSYIESNLPYQDYLKVADIDDNTPQDDPRVVVMDGAFNECAKE